MDTRSIFERRLGHEWQLLNDLAACNPGRITDVQLDGCTMQCRLHGPVALSASDITGGCLLTSHDVRIEFPVHFPAVPMEMSLKKPAFHPNIHPETGFVCLWDRHRVSNTVEHALHKLAAMLSGHLQNKAAPHVMQPEACHYAVCTKAMPLIGVRYHACPATPAVPGSRRLRLQ